MKFPKPRLKMPSGLQGQENGKLDSGLLEEFGLAKFKLYGPAARSFAAMRAHAAEDGVYLSATGTYRPYDRQKNLFLNRFVTYDTGRTSKVFEGVRYWLREGVAMAAVPGTSNHGWGLAVDVALDADSDLEWEWPPVAVDRFALDWLLQHADDYGWAWELDSEPWHIRYYVGDETPKAFRPSVPYPTPSIDFRQEFEMNIVTPVRLYDSRGHDGPFGHKEVRRIRIGDVDAAFVNVTVVPFGEHGHITVWGDGPQPNVSNVNYFDRDVCNTSWVPVVDGHINVFSYNKAHVIIDLQATS